VLIMDEGERDRFEERKWLRSHCVVVVSFLIFLVYLLCLFCGLES
jgi:hypothetical protein